MSQPSITKALREAADLLDAHPDLPQPYITSSSNGTVELNWFIQLDGAELIEQKRAAARIVKAVGGKWDKGDGEWGGGIFRFTQTRGSLSFDVQVQRDAVCERVVVGTETVTIPAKPAEPERTVQQEKVEWRCEPLLADTDPGTALAEQHIAEAKAAAGVALATTDGEYEVRS